MFAFLNKKKMADMLKLSVACVLFTVLFLNILPHPPSQKDSSKTILGIYFSNHIAEDKKEQIYLHSHTLYSGSTILIGEK